MDFNITSLSQEVNRILRAKYLCSLQTLHKILKQVDGASLDHWASNNRCRLQALVPVVLNALPRVSCALDILGILSINEWFRRGVVEAEPLLLETLLRQSVETDHGFNKCSVACVNLLSSPTQIAIPASITPFLAKLLRNASQYPSTENIRPVYKILSGSGSHMLNALPSKVVSRMQEQCKDMLQKFKIELEGNCANLFCLAVLATISGGDVLSPIREQEDSSAPAPTASSTASKEPTVDRYEARRFFTKRALKTLDLVVLKMVYACSKDCKLSGPDIAESLQISNVILNAINETDRATWMGKNQAKISKLTGKITSHSHSPEVLCLALQSIVTLFGGSPLPDALLPACRLSFRSSTASSLPHEARVKLMLLLDESSVQECLISLLQVSDDSVVQDARIHGIEAALILVESLIDSITTSASLRHNILYLLSTNALADPLRRFLNSKNRGVSPRGIDDHNDRCPRSYAERRMFLRRKICIMLIKTSFFAQHDDLSLDPSTASVLLDTLADAEQTYPACQSYTDLEYSRHPILVSLFETGSTPCSTVESDQWRHRIRTELNQNTEYQYQGLIRTMEDVCQDLERRCNEVEAPLREEKAKSAELRAEVEESRLQVAKLSSQTHEQSLVLEGIEGENAELQERVAHLENEKNELFGQTEDLRQELEQAIEQAETAGQDHIREIRELELVQTAVVAEKDELLEAQARKDTDSAARKNRLEEQIVELQANIRVHEDNTGGLEGTISKQQTELRSINTLIGEKQYDLNRLQDLLDGSRTENSNLQADVTRLSNVCQELDTTLEDKIATVNDQLAGMEALRRHNEAEHSAQARKLAQLRQSSDETNEELQRAMSKQAQDALALEQKDSTILDLEDRLETLKRDLDDRDNELEEAQALNEQVVKFWSKQRQRNAKAEEIPAQDDSSNPLVPHHKRTSVRFPKESPVHKRSRIARSSSSLLLSQKKRRASDDIRQTAVCNKVTPRRPLAEVDEGLQTRLNLSPTRSRLRKGTPKQLFDENNADENMQPGMAEGSVCDSDFFTSTDQQLIDNIHDDPPHFGLPDDTTEF